MRRERHPHVRPERLELLFDLRCVPMARHSVGADVLIDRDEVRALGRRPARPGHAGLRVDHDVVDQSLARERREREHRGRREAAGICDEVRCADLLPVALGKPVDRLIDHARDRVLAVPQLIHLGVSQPEVGAQVDDSHAALAQRCDERCRGAVRVCHDGGVDVGVPVEIEFLEHDRHAVIRVEVVQPASYVGPCRERAELEARVVVQQPCGERAGVPGSPEHRDARRHGFSLRAPAPTPR